MLLDCVKPACTRTFTRENQRTYLKISREVKDFLLSDKSREFFIFLFFFFVAGGFWLLQTLNNDYEADFSIPVRLKGVRFHEAQAHPGEGRAARTTPGERDLEKR